MSGEAAACCCGSASIDKLDEAATRRTPSPDWHDLFCMTPPSIPMEAILQQLARITSMASTDRVEFDRRYQSHLKHLKLQGLQPKTIDAYARGIRRMGEYFDHQIDSLCADQ